MSRFLVGATWDDVPHLTQSAKDELWGSILPHHRDARAKGIPQLGAGAIYPIAESDIRIKDFEIPDHWWRGYGMDCGGGANATAAAFGAFDPDGRVLYITNVYKRAASEPSIHAAAIRERMGVGTPRGWNWPGVGDAAALILTDKDAEQLVYLYRRLGLDLALPDKAVESGIADVWELMTKGRLRVFASCQAWFEEFRMYQRDKRGRIKKTNDHVMDSCLVGDTEVITDQGPRTLRSLVGVDGWVLTRAGAWVRYCGARQTWRDEPVVRLTFEDGSSVTCTLDHPFLTPDGWVRADQMAGRGCYNGVTQRIQRSHNDLRRPFKRFADAVTTGAASISSVMASAFIAWSGRPRITSADMGAESRLKRWLRRVSGTDLRPVARGIASTIETPRQRFIGTDRSRAPIAGTPLPPGSLEPTGFVPPTAKHRRGKRLAWTMSNGLAWCVAEGLWRIATWRNAPVRARALLRCLAVEPAGHADVYCLTVPATSSFCLANGAVVHNTRYLVRTGIPRMRPKTKPVLKKEQMSTEPGTAGLAWLGS